MKLSRYNSYISLGEKAGLIFNAFTDSFVAVKSSSDGFAKVRNGDITSISSELQKQLEEAGAVVADDFDEVDALRKRIDEIDNNDSFLLHDTGNIRKCGKARKKTESQSNRISNICNSLSSGESRYCVSMRL